MKVLSKTKIFKGVYSALPTPFNDDDSIDFSSWEKLIDQQIKAKVHGIVPCGTTGESPALNEDEKFELIERAVKKCRGTELQVIAGTGSNNTQDTVKTSKMAEKLGADACLVVTPYYNKPTQEGLLLHFNEVAEHAPVILYNVPSRTSVSLAVPTVVKLSAHKNIVGIKEATGNLALFTEMKIEVAKNMKTPKPFCFLTGDDPTLWSFFASSGDGVISVASNLLPRCIRMIFEDWSEGRVGAGYKLFEHLFPLLQNLFIETNPVPVKYLMQKRGIIPAKARLPLSPLSKANEEKLLTTWNDLLDHLKNDQPREDLRG